MTPETERWIKERLARVHELEKRVELLEGTLRRIATFQYDAAKAQVVVAMIQVWASEALEGKP
jgi:hypothetical protein